MRVEIKEYISRFGYRGLKTYFLSKICRIIEPNFDAEVRISQMQQTKCRLYRLYLRNSLIKKYGIEVSATAKIGKKLHIEHVNGIVVGAGVVVGDNCTIYQGVTLGQKNRKYPVIGDNVTIYPGAKVIGDIKIGDNVVIGTNSVVLHDVASNYTVAGNPAKVIKRN